MSNAIKGFAVVLALVVGFFAQDILSLQAAPANKTLAEHCQLSTQPCEQSNVVVTISQDTAQPLLPVTMVAQWPNSAAETLSLTLHGYEMDMGNARFTLNKADSQQFSGEVLLPGCTSKEMTWIGQLTDGKQSIDVAIRMAR
ncbi:hypothetical protein [Vibrio taketomensis]|uniref:hypothetical protein n=1 Tax=Vibrio taketomensis TaxID=2572923 RepID=UPI0013898F1B|nr:hypothetical protein [Vibrio taketomensis]